MAAEKVYSAEEATSIAQAFVKKHRFGVGKRPRKAQRSDDVWTVELDIGLFETKVATVQVDARSGAVVGYAFPD